MDINELTITSVLIILMILSGAWFFSSVVALNKLRKQEELITSLHNKMQGENIESLTSYSQKLLDFVKMLTTQVAILKFKTFVDNHEIEKVTKVNVRELAGLVANTVKDSINIDNIDFSDILFTKEFYEDYIIEVSITTIKSLLEKTISEYE